MSTPAKFWYPNVQQIGDPVAQDAIRRAYDAINQLNLTVSALVAQGNVTAQQQAATAGAVAQQAAAASSLASLNSLVGGSSTPLTNQASVLTVLSGQLSYTSTTTSITWSWSSLVLYYPDGSEVTLADGSLAISGLTSNTTYLFYPYTVNGSQTVSFATGGTGTPPVAFTSASPEAAAEMVADGNTPLSLSAMSASTPTSGSGGGSGGGGGGGGRPVV